MAEIKVLAPKALARRLMAAAQHSLFPPVCAGCRRIVSEPGSLCGACWRNLCFLERPWCAVMGTPFPYEMGEGFLSAEAIARPPAFDRARAAVAYEGVAGRMVQALKYADRTDLAPWMARWMLRAGAELLPDAEAVVPVPLHWRRFWQRRFNQSAELGRAVAGLSGLSGLRFAPEAAVRVKPTRRQVGLKPREREDNVRAAFRVPPEHSALVAGRRILVVDDVYTTGATVGALAKALKRAGAARVDVLTFARVLPPGVRDGLGEGGFRAEALDLI